MSCYRPWRVRNNGTRYRQKRYVIGWTNAAGLWQTRTAYTDKTASKALRDRLIRDAERERAGLPVVAEGPRLRPLDQVIDEYLAEHTRAGKSDTYLYEQRRLLTTLRTACSWSSLSAIRADSLRAYLAQVAKKGRGARTINSYRDAVVMLCNWAVEQNYLSESPLGGVKKARGKGGLKRKPRRAYSHEEFTRLCAASLHNATVYLIAGLSGLRKSELRQLQKRDLDPTGNRPVWRLRPEIAKGRRADVVPMLPECAHVLKPLWLSLPRTTSRLFRTVPRTLTLNKDLARAKLQKIDADGRCLDFHSLRYFFCVELSKRLPIVKVQRLMRHRDIRQTANLYAALGVDDLGEDVWVLPIGLFQPPSPASLQVLSPEPPSPASLQVLSPGAQPETAHMHQEPQQNGARQESNGQ